MKFPSRLGVIYLLSFFFTMVVIGTVGKAYGQANIVVNLPIVLKNFSLGYGSISGRVIDASKQSDALGYYIQDALVCAGDFWCERTDGNGRFTLSQVSSPWQVVKASKDGYYDASKVVNIPIDGSTTVNFVLAPVIQVGGSIIKRIVLTWDETPSWQNPNPGPDEPIAWANDLDAHLWLDVPGLLTHIGYFDQGNNQWDYYEGDCTTFPNACLESDYQEGFGPETIAMSKLEIATYYFGILNYNQYRSGVPSITATKAKVDVYDEGGLVETFPVPESGEGNFWFVFTMSSDGSVATLTPMNCITYYTGDLPDCGAKLQLNDGLPTKHLVNERGDFRPIGSEDLRTPIRSKRFDHLP